MVWVAEGFIKPSKTQSLEEVAEEYIKDLVDRNLISNPKIGLDGEIKSCSIHDLLRDLCLKKAEKENFLCVMRVGNIRQGIDTERCFVFNQGRVSKPTKRPDELFIVESAFLARSLAGTGDSTSNKFKMLRILNAPDSYYSWSYIMKQANLRYISIYACLRLVDEGKYHRLHSSISLLWNLQTLTINGPKNIVAPREIWEMQQLRHVNVISTIWLPDPPLSNQDDDEFVVMRNTQTLERVRDLRLTEEVCKRIPNIKRLRVVYENITSHLFGRLHKLESLECQFNARPRRVDLLQNLTFPNSLQELYLQHSYLHWEDLSMIGSLPNLRVLQLGEKSVVGSEWNPVEGEFLSLRSLKLDFCGELINWNAESSHFPLLEKLILRFLPNLNEIPSDFGEIPTLAEIRLYQCSNSLNISAVRILDQQESFGNEGLRVEIGLGGREKAEWFKEKIAQFESSTSNNLLIYDL